MRGCRNVNHLVSIGQEPRIAMTAGLLSSISLCIISPLWSAHIISQEDETSGRRNVCHQSQMFAKHGKELKLDMDVATRFGNQGSSRCAAFFQVAYTFRGFRDSSYGP